MEFAFVFMILVTMVLGIIEFQPGTLRLSFRFRRGAIGDALGGRERCYLWVLGDNSCNGTSGMNSGPASARTLRTT